MKEATEINCNSDSLQWLLEFNVNELFTEDDKASQEQENQSSMSASTAIRKSTRVRTSRKKNSYSEEEEWMGPSPPPPAVARFEECSSSSSSETASDGSEKKQTQKKRRVAKSPGKTFTTDQQSASGFDESNKPRCTYTELIERALHENPEGLTVSQIYSWIAKNHAFFRLDDDRWKNSVRHNLSINPYFEKRGKCKNGAGHVWTIAESCRRNSSHDAGVEEYEMDTHETRAHSPKHGQSNGSLQYKTETERIVGGILQQYKIELNNNRTQQRGNDKENEEKGAESANTDADDEIAKAGGEGETHAHENVAREAGSQSPIVNEHEDLLITTGIPLLRQNGHVHHFDDGCADGGFGSDSHNYIDYSELFAPQPQSVTVVNQHGHGHGNEHEFNEFELLTLEALEANNNHDNFIIIASNTSMANGHGHGHDGHGHEGHGHGHGSTVVTMDTDSHSFYTEHQELIEIQADHLFHTKELLLADEDDSQITTMQL